jgi:hypothetical protein
MANKKINELTAKTDVLKDDDLIMIFDSEESGSEKTKKVAVSNYIAVISTSTTINVATTGSDSTGDGSAGSPFASINGALNWLKNKMINTDVGVTIQLADGTYNAQTYVNFMHPCKTISVKGNSSTPANVTLNFATGQGGIQVTRNAYLALEGIKCVGYDKSEWKAGLSAARGGSVHVKNCIFDNWGVGIQGSYGGMVYAMSGYTLNNCNYGANGYAGGFAYLYAGTVSNCLVGAQANEGGRIHHTASVLFSGNSQNTATATGGTVTNG